MKYDLIASGSKGNSLLISKNDTMVLFDFGISKRKVTNACYSYGKSFDDIKAFFLTHLHSDHSSQIKNARKDDIFCGADYIENIDIKLDENHHLKAFKPVFIDALKITPLPLSHDCKESDTYGFLIEDDKEKLAYITDTGFIPEVDYDYLYNLDYYIFESNHDPKLLYESNRPEYLINRIISDKGHLSNSDSSYYLTTFLGDKTKEIVLSHLSEECNSVSIAKDTFYKVANSILGYIPDINLKISTFDTEIKGGE